MSVFKLKVSYLLLVCAIVGRLALTLPYPDLPGLVLATDKKFR